MSTRTITLTGRAPVEIDEDQWPEIAVGRAWKGEFEKDATRIFSIRVRKNTDGRALVYGLHKTRWQGERDAHAGLLLEDGEDLATAIQTVAATLGESLRGTRQERDTQTLLDAAQRCIASLPAERI